MRPHTNKQFSPALFFKVMKSAADASARVDGTRHQNGMKINNDDVKVCVYVCMCMCMCVKKSVWRERERER